MSNSLIDRFRYGHSQWPAPFTPEAEMYIEGAKRQREMIYLARQQIDAQNLAAKNISQSNLIGAQIIAKELGHQTKVLDNSIKQVGNLIAEEVSASTEKITSAIDHLNDSLCFELSEIQWQLAQLNKTLEKILKVLSENRSNEARQLVQQGVRHFVNEEIDEAEERFKLALSFDTTDYQVLMNLGYIEIHKNNASEAISFFKKAINLPENINNASKVRALWTIARLYYAEQDFSKAFSYAEKGFQIDSVAPRNSYIFGVYAALSGNQKLAIKHINDAIIGNAIFFSKAAVDQDLEIIRNEILTLLGQIANDLKYKVEGTLDSIKNNFLDIKDICEISNTLKEKINEHINISTSFLKNTSSYSELIRINKNISILHQTINKLRALTGLSAKKAVCASSVTDLESKWNEATKDGMPSLSKESGLFGWLKKGKNEQKRKAINHIEGIRSSLREAKQLLATTNNDINQIVTNALSEIKSILPYRKSSENEIQDFLLSDECNTKIMEYIIFSFIKKEGINLSKDSFTIKRIQQEVSDLIENLKLSNEVQINLPYISANSNGPVHLEMKIDRDMLEKFVKDKS